MSLILTPEQRLDLEQAAAHARQTRSWKRYQALLLLGDGQRYAQVAQNLDRSCCARSGWPCRRCPGLWTDQAPDQEHARARP